MYSSLSQEIAEYHFIISDREGENEAVFLNYTLRLLVLLLKALYDMQPEDLKNHLLSTNVIIS